MRAREFVIEQDGTDWQTTSSCYSWAQSFSDGERWSTDYTLNRVMMAVACTDGTFVPDVDEKSWVGKNKTAHPYTKQEQDMLKMAYKAAGAVYTDLNKGDMDSEEHPAVHSQSPIKAFGGY
jgi:hypothetical protein